MSLYKAKVILKPYPKGQMRFDHPWIYRSQIKETENSPKPGDIVEVWTKSRRFVGIGYFNPHSEIIVRILTTKSAEPVDKAFMKSKISQALNFRKSFVKSTNAFRVVSSEADELPGLIVDKYDDVAVVQFLTLGMENLRPFVLEALEEIGIAPSGIYEKSDSGSRRIEGLQEKIGWLRKDCGDEIIIFEKNVQVRIRFESGQKTGFYLDQRENRLLFPEMGIKGKILDAFCYSGGFGLHLALSGSSVLGIDSQKEALEEAEANRSLNGIGAETLRFKLANVFDELKILEKEKEKFDFVILDPPSFVKKREALEGALSGYKEILLRAMRLLNEGGLLAVFSCSYHVGDALLMETALSAAIDVKKKLRVLKFLKQSADHPINPFIPETYYLKGFLFSVSSL